MTRPFYEHGGITLYHGDCLQVHRWLGADVLITDPPYGTQLTSGSPGGGYGRRHFVIVNDETTEVRDAALARWGDRPAMCFGSPRQPDPPLAIVDRLVWDKKRPGMNGGPWRYRHESIYVTAGFLRTSNAAVSVIASWPADQVDHMHAKPIGLMTQLVAAAPPGVIADPFAGSGSTLVAAKLLGREAIGVEYDEGYCELIVRRLEQGALEFAPLPPVDDDEPGLQLEYGEAD